MQNDRLVVVVSTGGTISSQSTDRGGYAPAFASGDLLGRISPWVTMARIETLDVSLKPSFALTVPEITDLANIIRSQLDRHDVHGVVLSMGTAAMDEVAYLLDLVVDSMKPTVVTGAMFPTNHPGYDGARNLHDAIKAVMSPGAPSGVMVCLAGQVHAARDVQKIHRTSPAPLVSWPGGPLGLLDADRTVWVRQPRGRRSFGNVAPVTPVDVVKATLGCDDRLMRAALTTGTAGLVIEGFPGGGGVPLSFMAAVRDAIDQGVPVVATSRSPFGRVVPVAAGGSGAHDLLVSGAIPSGDLTAPKARLLLMCALAVTREPAELRAIFEEVAP